MQSPVGSAIHTFTGKDLMRTLDALCATAFVVIVTLAPGLYSDLYPISSFPMFSDNRDQCWTFEVIDAKGETLPAMSYGLYDLAIGNSNLRYGRTLPKSIVKQHDRIDSQTILAFLNRHYGDQSYPIVIEAKHHRYDSAARQIVKIVEVKLVVDRDDDGSLVAIGASDQ